MALQLKDWEFLETKTIYEFTNTDFKHPLINRSEDIIKLFEFFDVSIFLGKKEHHCVISTTTISNIYCLKPKEHINIIDVVMFMHLLEPSEIQNIEGTMWITFYDWV